MRQRGEITTRTLLIVGAILLFMGLAAVASGMAAFSGANKGDNTLGAQAASPANPVDPKTKQMLTSIQEASNPGQFLQLNSDEVTKVLGQLTDLRAYWESQNTFKDDSLKQAAEAQLDTLQQKYERLESLLTQAGTGSTAGAISSQDEVGKLRQDIAAAAQELQRIVAQAFSGATGKAADAINLAIQLVERNQNGAGIIPYAEGVRPYITAQSIKNGTYNQKPVPQAAISMDCSGFISYVLVGTGVLATPTTTEGIANESASFTQLNLDTNKDGVVQESEVTDALKNGTLLPGDVIVTGLIDGHKGGSNTHAVMVLSTSVSDGKSVAESTDTGPTKNGPQYDSIQDRMSRIKDKSYGKDVVFVRPHYQS